jgi:hypothetical protein
MFYRTQWNFQSMAFVQIQKSNIIILMDTHFKWLIKISKNRLRLKQTYYKTIWVTPLDIIRQ